jgi:hypothetical protein
VLTCSELEAAWSAAPPPARERGQVDLIVVRKGAGAHETPARVTATVEGGLAGDRWSIDDRDPLFQVTLMMTRVARLLGEPLDRAGDNLLVDLDLSEEALPVGARLLAGAVVLEVTPEPHLGCKKFSERFGAGALRWVNLKEHRHRRLRGVNCRVVEGGEVAVGDAVRVLP